MVSLGTDRKGPAFHDDFHDVLRIGLLRGQRPARPRLWRRPGGASRARSAPGTSTISSWERTPAPADRPERVRPRRRKGTPVSIFAGLVDRAGRPDPRLHGTQRRRGERQREVGRLRVADGGPGWQRGPGVLTNALCRWRTQPRTRDRIEHRPGPPPHDRILNPHSVTVVVLAVHDMRSPGIEANVA